jgi:DNA polymerase I-like protein with 3'-5' exonuclease and polymerase domains
MMQLSLFDMPVPRDDEALKRCSRAEVVAIDIETETRYGGQGPKLEYGLSYPAPITIIAFAWREGNEVQTTAVAAPFDEAICDLVKTLFTRQVVAHNAVFDMRQLSKLTGGSTPEKIWDTMIMGRLLHPQPNTSYSLLGVADMLQIPFTTRHVETKAFRSKLHQLPLETAIEYAQDDARLTFQIYERQQELEANAELVDWECRAMREYCRMTAQGIRLNLTYIEQYLVELRARRDQIALVLMQDGLLSPGSPKARVKYLYHQKGIPLPQWNPDSPYFTRTGRRRLRKEANPQVRLEDLSTSADVINSYMEANPKFAPQLQALSEFLDTDWLISTLESLRDHAFVDERVHSLVTIATDTGRRAASHPQMQNWTMPAMAGVATADDGFTLVEIDYSNAENVMAALISADDNLSAACATDDFHSSMGLRYFGAAWEKADAPERKRLRDMSKKITYGTAYGMGARRLSESIGVTLQEGYQFLRAKDAAFPNVTRTKRRAEAQVIKENRLSLWTGRVVAVQTAFVAWNYLCQGGVSEMLKRAIVRVSEAYRERGMRSRVALDMHDALILEVAHDEWDDALSIASAIMMSIVPDELSQLTSPPVRFRAKPKLEENQRKWGAFQWHPASK